MVVIGLTGGSGSGKSTLASLMREHGITVIDADQIGRQVVKKGQPALEEIVAAYGKEILLSDGELNRRKLGSIVFSNREKLRQLNAITHKYITAIVKEQLSHAQTDISVIDAAVLKESGILDMCDYVIAVVADKQIRIDRIMARDGLTRQEAENRIASQDPDAKYVQYADFVVDNSEGESLESLLGDILNRIGGGRKSER